MKEVKKFDSRFKNINTTLSTLEDKEFLLSTNGRFSKCLLAQDGNSVSTVTFEGGPEFSVGETIEGIGEIEYIYSGYLIRVK